MCFYVRKRRLLSFLYQKGMSRVCFPEAGQRPEHCVTAYRPNTSLVCCINLLQLSFIEDLLSCLRVWQIEARSVLLWYIL